MSSGSPGPSRRSERLPKKPRLAEVTSPTTRTSLTLATKVPTTHPSSLASVVHKEFRTWRKIPTGHLLASYHQRFWGKSMEDEEKEWQKTQTQIEGQLEGEDEGSGRAIGEDDNEIVKVEEYEGKGKGRVINEDDTEAMDEDKLEGEATDEDDDVIPGCYPFSVGIENITVWIRADYIRLYKALEDYYEQATKQKGRTPSAVVTGQPGIGESRYFAFSTQHPKIAHQGKSLWIYYAARRRLAEQKPFIWFYAARYYLFVQEGVYGLPTDWEHFDFRYIMWTLVDLKQSSTGVPEYLVPHGTRLFVIYVTSPAEERWSRLEKTTRPITTMMNPWSRSEIVRVWVYFLTSPYLRFSSENS